MEEVIDVTWVNALGVGVFGEDKVMLFTERLCSSPSKMEQHFKCHSVGLLLVRLSVEPSLAVPQGLLGSYFFLDFFGLLDLIAEVVVYFLILRSFFFVDFEGIKIGGSDSSFDGVFEWVPLFPGFVLLSFLRKQLRSKIFPRFQTCLVMF